MTQELEIEFKNMLTKKEYTNLLTFYGGSSPNTWVQTNYYMDTPDLALKKQKSALRIRQLPDRAECTLKTPYQNHLLETTTVLTKQEAQEMIDSNTFVLSEQMNSMLTNMDIDVKQLTFLVSLTTERFEQKYGECLLVLDKSTYGTKEDYELEIESTNETEGLRFFHALLDKHRIPVRKTENKVRRAMKETALF